MHPLPIGKTDDAFDSGRVLTISPDARRKHIAIFGKSGVGKSTLLRNMIAWDIEHGAGVAVEDPHGSLVDEILETIPRRRTNDVIYFNPKDRAHAMALNIFDQGDAHERALLVSYLISIFKALWRDSWGPRMEDILRNAAFALSEQPQPVSLLAIPRLLTHPNYRSAVLRHVKNPAVRGFFHTYEHGWTKQFREEAISPVLNKVNAFITNPLLRAVIGQATSAFRFRWVMDTGKILLCDLSKGALGEDVSALLGSLITTKLYLAALSRQEIPESERRPFVVYADEVQNFIHGVQLPTILSEARKYGLSLTIATQVITQLPNECIDAVFGNCATVISFRVSGNDAETLKREFSTVIPASALQDLSDFKTYVRTMTAEPNRPPIPYGPVSVKTFPAFQRQGTENDKARVIEASLRRYSRPRPDVEAKLKAFFSAQSS
jgi:hypothetical protein